MGIDLRGDEVGVAEQFLHAAQIRAGVEQMRGVAVAELVRREVRVEAGYLLLQIGVYADAAAIFSGVTQYSTRCEQWTGYWR